MFNWSNFDILRLLQQEPGRLKEFLLEVPLDDLQDAVDEKQLRADMRHRQSRQQHAFKKNVLDMNLDVVIDMCYQQKIINFFGKKLALEKARIQNHPEYGHRLVNQCPEKYFLGNRSEHFNRARQIEEAYGIFRFHHESEDDNSNQQANESEQGNNDQQNNQDEPLGQNDENQEIPNNEEQDEQHYEDEDSADNFIASSDEDIEEDELSEDSVEEKIRNRKKAKKAKKQSCSEQKVERTQEKLEISEKTTQRKLRKPVSEAKQQIHLEEEYLIEPQQLNFTALQAERSKRNQKKIKQEQKRLQFSFSTNPSTSNASEEFIAEKQVQPFVAPRKTRKMNLELD